jgi:hypothetical protein
MFSHLSGSLLNLNLHFHLLVLDGAFICREKKRPFFHKIEEPRSEAIGELLTSIIEAVELCLAKQGLLEEDASMGIEDDLLSVEAASRASVGQTIAFGERRGQRVRRIGFSRQGELMEFKGPQCVARSGFSLHAARQIHREDRQGLSQLINYMARPPIAEERLTRNAAGDIEYRLRQPWTDGTTGIKCKSSLRTIPAFGNLLSFEHSLNDRHLANLILNDPFNPC